MSRIAKNCIRVNDKNVASLNILIIANGQLVIWMEFPHHRWHFVGVLVRMLRPPPLFMKPHHPNFT